MAKRASRKRRDRRRGRAERPPDAPPASPENSVPGGGYARSRAKDAEARASLKPLRRGERPRAVTVGAVVAALMALVNLVALALAYESDEPGKALSTLAGTGLLMIVAVGMWRSRYSAVLGMQTLLAIAIIIASLDLLGTTSARNALLAVVVIAASGTLFWHLVKAMARIQMPARPGSTRR